MRRVSIVGGPGAGKSTLARAIGDALGLPVVHLDLLYWNAGWEPTPADVFVLKVSDALAGDAWVCDGNYGATLDLRLRRSDTVIVLGLPRALTVWRSFVRRGRARPDLPATCPEKRFDRDALRFLLWGWRDYPRDKHPKILASIERNPHLRVITLRSRGDVRRFLASLSAGDQSSPPSSSG